MFLACSGYMTVCPERSGERQEVWGNHDPNRGKKHSLNYLLTYLNQ